jgi:hypothetical protein
MQMFDLSAGDERSASDVEIRGEPEQTAEEGSDGR